MCRTDQTHPRPIRRSVNTTNSTNNTSRRRTRGGSPTSSSSFAVSSSFWSLGRVGKLQIGVHALLGLASLILTGSSVILYNNPPPPHRPENEDEDANDKSFLVCSNNRWSCCHLLVLASSQICNAILVFQASSLLPQVPPWTVIVPGVVAPHKEAFRRTISAMQYLIARVLVQWMTTSIGKQQQQQQQETTSGGTTTAIDDLPSSQYYALLSILLWRWYPLLPNLFNAEWSNGNTWIFVWPIFLGISGDLYQYVAWGDNCVSIGNLLTGQLLGLGLAFGFTLGFRRYVPMAVVYALAAVSVWYMIQQGIVTIRSCNR